MPGSEIEIHVMMTENELQITQQARNPNKIPDICENILSNYKLTECGNEILFSV